MKAYLYKNKKQNSKLSNSHLGVKIMMFKIMKIIMIKINSFGRVIMLTKYN